MSRAARIRVPVHYDFASSLCFVAHRVLGRMTDFLEAIEVDLVWTPIDLTRLTGWRPGARIDPNRRDEIRLIADALVVSMQVPTHWPDSQRVAAATLALLDRDDASPHLEATWRERIFCAVYEHGRPCDDAALVDETIAGMGLELRPDEIERGIESLDARTTAAAEAMVTGVPTFMLGPWPLGGIHDELTLRSMLGRFAERQRRVS